MSFLRAHLTLIKWRISLFASLAAGLGYVLESKVVAPHTLYPMAGVFVLAAGAGALNQYQERVLDAHMARTRRRPIPLGVLTPGEALAVASMLILYGLMLLAIGAGLVAAGLGIFSILWYNGLYTWLKRLTSFAALPGALVGAVPPLIGWVAAGGQVLDIRILAVGFFFFIWQVPHFWLLLLKHGEDYRSAGLPTLRGKLTDTQLARVTFVWTASSGVASLMIPLFGHQIHPSSGLALLVAAIWIIVTGSRLVRGRAGAFPPHRITLFMLLAISFLSIGTLLS